MPTTFDLKCIEVAKRLDIPVEQVVAIFDEYDAVSLDWAIEPQVNEKLVWMHSNFPARGIADCFPVSTHQLDD